MSVESTAETWHRADYILRGEYCPLDEVHAELDRIRIDTLQASLVIHLALDHESVLRSLGWISGGAAGDGLARALQEGRFRTAIRNLLVYSAREHSEQRVAHLDPAVTIRIAERVRLLDQDDEGRLAQLPVDGWDGLVLNHTGRDGLPPRPGEVRSILLVHGGVIEAIANLRDQLQTLGVMLKCTFRADTRRDAVVMQQVAEKLTIADADDADFPAMANQALTLAREITNSAAGAVYLISSEQGTGYERTAVQAADPYGYPPTIAVGEETSVGWSIGRHRAYQSEPGETAFGPARTVTADGGVELVTPIAGALATTVGPAIGAIALYRADESAHYGAYEKALVRNIALRLALRRTTMATRRIANAISALRRTSLIHGYPDSSGSTGHPDWPRDISAAAQRLGEPLRELAEGTQSHSVSLRIALPDRSGPEHGLVLTRVAAHPPDEKGVPPEVRDGHPGPHWEVLRTDTEVYVRDTAVPHEFEIGRPGTASALCVPVRVEGILAGTLHLESPLVNNYEVFLPIIDAFCGAVGRTLADARAAQERRMLDRAAHALTKRHEFSGDIGWLKEHASDLGPSRNRDEMLSRIAGMDATIQDLREREERGPVEAATLWEIIERAMQPIKLAVLQRPTQEIYHRRLDRKDVRSVTDLFTSVVRNINHHSTGEAYDPDGQPVPRVRCSTSTIQGTNQAVIVLESRSSTYLDEAACRELYRYPIDGQEGELRLGTYIAGLNARRVGGRIHACALEDYLTFRTTIIIPVEGKL